MKKMKFTLGLMLAMLILGANVGQAQLAYNNGLPHDGYIEQSIFIQGCDFYIGSITFDTKVKDMDGGYGYPAAANTFAGTSIIGDSFSSSLLPFNDFAFWIFDISTLPYGSGEWVEVDAYGKGFVPLSLRDYYFDETAHQYVCNPYTGNLFYWLVKSKTEVYNRIEVPLTYTAGNELKPILKRYITLGEWKTVVYNNPKDPKDVWNGLLQRNELFSTGIVIEQIIIPDSTHFRPHMDRETENAIYIWKDPILPLLDKYIIYAIDYEVSVYDEIDYLPGNTIHPPSSTLPTNARKVFIEAADGITTSVSSKGSAIYVPTKTDFVFTAFSDSEITAATVTLHQPYGDFDEINRRDKGVKVKNNLNGSYTITIQQVNYEMLIRINSEASLTSEPTGNFVIAPNAVWSAAGTLFVQSAKQATLSIYSVTGQLIKQISVTGSYTMTLPKGLYIVKLDGQAYKIIN